jgi:hypothetical protein
MTENRKMFRGGEIYYNIKYGLASAFLSTYH